MVQLNSFEAALPCPPVFRSNAEPGAANGSGEPYRAVFIRAPGILECGKDVEVLSGAPFALGCSVKLLIGHTTLLKTHPVVPIADSRCCQAIRLVRRLWSRREPDLTSCK